MQIALKGAIFVALGALLVGSAPIGLRLSEMGPQATAFWRFALALPFLIVFARLKKIEIGPPSLPAIGVGLFFGIDIAFWHAAVMNTSVANATFLVNTGSIASGLLAWFILGLRPRITWPFAAMFALVGAALMSFGASNGGSGAIKGDILALVAACALSVYFVMTSLARRDRNAVTVLIWATVTSMFVSALSSLAMSETLVPLRIQSLAAPLFLAICAHVLGQGFIIYGGGLAPPSISGVVVMLQPVASALVAWPLFAEPLNAVQLAGAAAILTGVWLASKR